ncbi:hypothetical protein [Catellatospora sp. NPDC049609]|uniref:hypothetical protein n=1 Tax=Catellatospora sp. NPDC049609 TaxID=3155505 RepID=UPI003448DA85
MTDLHPHQLHARSAAWSLDVARHRLGTAIGRARAAALTEQLTSAAPVRAWSPSTGGGGGGHGDPTAGAALGVGMSGPAGRSRSADLWGLAESVTDTLWWLAGKLGFRRPQWPQMPADPVALMCRAVPRLHPWTAAQLALWFGEADGQIRTLLYIAPDDSPVPGMACPACGVRQLSVLTASVATTVVCRATGCHCAGEDCPCRMPVRAAGVGHIWSTGSDLADRARKVLAG